MLRELIKHLVREREKKKQTNQQAKPQMKYKTGERECEANFIRG